MSQQQMFMAAIILGALGMWLMLPPGAMPTLAWACAWTPEKTQHGQTSLAMAPRFPHFGNRNALTSVDRYA
jgi:hypothetical protein